VHVQVIDNLSGLPTIVHHQSVPSLDAKLLRQAFGGKNHFGHNVGGFFIQALTESKCLLGTISR